MRSRIEILRKRFPTGRMIEYYTTFNLRTNVPGSPRQLCGRIGLRLGRAPSKFLGSGDSGRAFRSLLVGCFVLLCCVGFSTSPLLAQGSIDDGREALTNKSYPWYDAKTDGTRRMELGNRPDARSANRHEIPLKKVRLKQNANNYTAPAGGGVGGGTNFGNSLLLGLNAMTWAIVIALVLLVIGVLIWAMLRMGSETGLDDDDGAIPKRSMAESIKQLPFELDSPTGDFRQQAQAAYASGDYRRAITFLFSHVLVTLDQNGLIRLRKGKTNRQYLNELRAHRSLASYYQHVMVPFEATFFGDHELSQADFQACWGRLDEFQVGVDGAARTAVTAQTSLSTQVANA